MQRSISIIFLIIGLTLFTVSFSSKEVTTEKIPKAKRISQRGIYVTYYMAQSPKYFNYLKEQCKKAKLNTIVVDAKEVLSRPYLALVKEHKLVSGIRAEPSPWLSKLTADLQKEGFIVTVRLVTFKDDHLVLTRPDLGIKVGGGLYRDRKGGKWANPYLDEVRLYNVLIAESAALSGVDEVQFDYIRFPVEGSARFISFPQEEEGISRVDIICQYLKEVKARLAPHNTSMAVDIFGVAAWQSKTDIETLGQDLKRMAPYLDVLSPMLYPSHFHNGYDGFANPGSEPYHFLKYGTKRSFEILSGEATALVPWIQGFNMKSPNFGPKYIIDQIKGAEEEGAKGFLIWNARNDYAVSFRALSTLTY